MKKLIIATLLGTVCMAGPALAESDRSEDVRSDVNAVRKDDSALEKDREMLRRHQEMKAEDKANGNYAHQAWDSMKIGADRTALGEKRAERDADRRILRHHENEDQPVRESAPVDNRSDSGRY